MCGSVPQPLPWITHDYFRVSALPRIMSVLPPDNVHDKLNFIIFNYILLYFVIIINCQESRQIILLLLISGIIKRKQNAKRQVLVWGLYPVTRSSLTTDRRLRPLGHNKTTDLSVLVLRMLVLCSNVTIQNCIKNITTTTPNHKPNPNVTVWHA